MTLGRMWVAAAVACAAVASVSVSGSVAAPAADRTVDITGRSEIVTRTSGAFVSENDKGRCVLYAFAMYPDVKGATQYSVVARGVYPSKDVDRDGPPFPDDVFELGDGRGGIADTFTVPPGHHWFPVFSSSSGTGCAEGDAYAKSHFSIASATATIGGKKEEDGAIEGKVVLLPELRPLSGIAVRALGTTGKAKGRTGTATTSRLGTYRIAGLPVGGYMVSATVPNELELETKTQSVVVAAGGTARADFRAKKASEIQVEVVATPEKPFVEQTVEGPKPVDISFVVKVTNRGKERIDRIFFPEKLTVGQSPTNPFRFLYQKGDEPDAKKPKPVVPPRLEFGSLAPGRSVSVTYPYGANGDGTASVEALVIGRRGLARLTGLGKREIRVDTDLLVVTATLDQHEKSAKNPGLITAGSPFSLYVKVENRSNERKAVILPEFEKAFGNVYGGYWRQHSVGPLDNFIAGNPSPRMPETMIQPRRVAELDAIFMTQASSLTFDPKAAREGKPGGGSGGNRATVLVGRPGAVATPPGDPSAPIEKWVDVDRDLIVRKSDEPLVIGIDDSGMVKRPWNNFTDPVLAYGRYSVGTVKGFFNFAWGTVRAVAYDLPVMLYEARNADLIGSALTYTEHGVDLWDAMGSADRARFLLRVQSAILSGGSSEVRAYIEKKGPGFWTAINDVVLADMSKMSAEWEGGDWLAAADHAGYRVGQIAPEIATLPVIEAKVATWARGAKLGILADMPEAAKALALTSKLKIAETRRLVDERIRAVAHLGADGVRDIFKNLGDPARLRYGFTFADYHLPALFGLTKKQGDFLRRFAQENKVLITVRSRATESIKWLNAKVPALLKPERIKTKNVNWIDVDYLGYDSADVGRVVYPLNGPPSEALVRERLASRGLKPGTKEFDGVLERRAKRAKEWVEEERDRRKWLAAGDAGVEEEWKFNWKDNEVDPTRAGEVAPTKVKVRLTLVRGKSARRVLEVSTDGGATWRSVTGDVDTVGITELDGSPISDEKYGELVGKLRGSDIGAEHPATDTWVDENGKIWFEKKEEQLQPGECCFVEFGPDGEARAVGLDLVNSRVKPPWDRSNFRLFWRGGYRHTMGWEDRLALGFRG